MFAIKLDKSFLIQKTPGSGLTGIFFSKSHDTKPKNPITVKHLHKLYQSHEQNIPQRILKNTYEST